jgi:predicted GNAT superfamily acetyltransferase
VSDQIDSAADTCVDVEFRVLRTASELAVLPPFEQYIWGGGGDAVSVNMLVAVVIEGGVAIGAFEGDRIVGSVFGFPTREPDVLHSHYLAVDPRWRRRGLGVELKQRQRAWCIEHGFLAMRWTYDPLQLANAHLNLRVLGAVGVSYHTDHYGTLGGINGDLPSDRVTVRWELSDQHPPGSPGPAGHVSSAAVVVVDVPLVSASDIATSNVAAHHARSVVRAELAHRLDAGWTIVDVDRDDRRYTLAPPRGER